MKKDMEQKRLQEHLPEYSYRMEHLELEKDLVKAVKDMANQVETLRDMELLQVLKHPGKLLWYSLLKGLMIGFGSVLGASVLITLFVYLLTQLSHIPVIGNYVDQILSKTENAQQDAASGVTLQEKYQESKKSLENNTQPTK